MYEQDKKKSFFFFFWFTDRILGGFNGLQGVFETSIAGGAAEVTMAIGWES